MKRTISSLISLALAFSISLRLAAADVQPNNEVSKTNTSAPYRWSETADYARVPKSFLEQLSIPAVTMTNGETRALVLTDQFIQTFKLTLEEVDRMAASLADALHQYRLEEGKHLVPTDEVLTAEPLQRLPPPAVDKLTFRVIPFPNEAKAIRRKLETNVLQTLGEERSKFFCQSDLMLESAMNTFSRPEMFRPTRFTYQLTDHAKLGLLVDLYQTSGGGGHGITYSAYLDQYAPESLKPVLMRWRKAIADSTVRSAASTETRREVDSPERVSPVTKAPSSTTPWDDKSSFVDLPKSVIKSLRIVGLTPEGEISSEAVTLFGLTPAELKSVRALYGEMKARFEQLEHAHFGHIGRNTFVVRAFPEKNAALQREWVEKLRDLAGKNRGELLDHSIRTPLSAFDLVRRRALLRDHVLLDSGPGWLHRGTSEVQIDIAPGAPDREGQPTLRIEYRTQGEGGGGTWGGRRDRIPERWRHLLTPEMLGMRLIL